MVGGCAVRLVTRIPADRGHVRSITVRFQYDGEAGADGIDITDVQLQPGDPTGVVPHPADVAIRTGGRQYRNGVVTRTTDEVIVLSNNDRAAPTRVDVAPVSAGEVRVGSFRFGRLTSPAYVDGEAGKASRGWGRAPVITERSDGHIAVTLDGSIVHMTVGWSERS